VSPADAEAAGEAVQLAEEARVIRRQVGALKQRAEDVAKRADQVRHDFDSIRGALLAVLDSLDELDRRIAELGKPHAT
jgi:uncharacterized coiled-coil DUF342 family protein